MNKIYKLSIEMNLPIVRDKTIGLIKKIIVDKNYKNILEIGGAIGYSSNQMLINKDIRIDSLEIKKELNDLAIKLDKSQQINHFNVNAFDFVPTKKYDLIFIDGPKSHQERLFNKYTNYLNDNGLIIIDNMYLNKVRLVENKTKNQQKLIDKVDKFSKWLINLKDWNVKIIDIDDGLAICERKI